MWTAQDLYYFPTKDEEVYKPEQVRVEGRRRMRARAGCEWIGREMMRALCCERPVRLACW